jgi:hypothetical protein
MLEIAHLQLLILPVRLIVEQSISPLFEMQIERNDDSALMFKKEICGIPINGKKGPNSGLS